MRGIPQLPPRYTFVREIGQGGMGAVVLVFDNELEREVALKLINPGRANEVALQRFVNEAKITSQLEHPAIMPVHDAGTLPGGSYWATGRTSTCSRRQPSAGQPLAVVEIADSPGTPSGYVAYPGSNWTTARLSVAEMATYAGPTLLLTGPSEGLGYRWLEQAERRSDLQRPFLDEPEPFSDRQLHEMHERIMDTATAPATEPERARE